MSQNHKNGHDNRISIRGVPGKTPSFIRYMDFVDVCPVTQESGVLVDTKTKRGKKFLCLSLKTCPTPKGRKSQDEIVLNFSVNVKEDH